MKPSIFEIESTGRIASNLYYCFFHWLEMDVYPREKCHSGKANPLVIKPKEVELLKKNFDTSIVPYIAINGEISEDEAIQTKKVIEKAAREYFGSIDPKNRKIDLVKIKEPENKEEFQDFLIHRLVEVGGSSEKQRKMLPEYISWFCLNSRVVKTLAGKIIMQSIEIERLEDVLGPGD